MKLMELKRIVNTAMRWAGKYKGTADVEFWLDGKPCDVETVDQWNIVPNVRFYLKNKGRSWTFMSNQVERLAVLCAEGFEKLTFLDMAEHLISNGVDILTPDEKAVVERMREERMVKTDKGIRYSHNAVVTKDGEVVVGNHYQYKEDDLIADVEILEDNSDEQSIRFKLKLIRHNQHEMPETFNVSAAQGHYAYGGMWRLYDAGTYHFSERSEP